MIKVLKYFEFPSHLFEEVLWINSYQYKIATNDMGITSNCDLMSLMLRTILIYIQLQVPNIICRHWTIKRYIEMPQNKPNTS